MKTTIILANSNSQKVRVAAYCRVSKETEEQISSLSIQEECFRSMLENNIEYEFIDIFVDKGKSGLRKKNRTEFDRMVKLAKGKKIDLIYVKSISRLARNTVDLLETVKILRSKKVYFYFEIEKINTKDAGKDFILTLFAALAQEESMVKSQNTTWGIRTAMRNGDYKMKKVYGYNVINHELYINEKEAEVIKVIFYMYTTLKFGANKIAKVLETMEILSPGGCKKWNSKTIIEILKNETYKGDIILQKTFISDVITGKREVNNGQLDKFIYINDHAPIVDEEVFYKANELRMSKEFGNHKENQFKPQYLLSKLLKCGECGSNYARRIERGKIVYRCSNRMHHGIEKCPCSITLKENEILDDLSRHLNINNINEEKIKNCINSIIVYESHIEIFNK